MKIAMRAIANNMFLCTDMGVGGTIIANRETAAQWESYELFVVNDDGSLTPWDGSGSGGGGEVIPPTPPSGGDAIDLMSATVASGDCPDVRSWPAISEISNITMTNVGVDQQGYSMNFPGRDTWTGVVPPGWTGQINHTLWMGLRIGGQWYILPVKEGLGDYLTLGPILMPGQVPNNLTYYASGPMAGYQPQPNEQVAFFCTTGDTRRMNIQAGSPGRTNVKCVPFIAGSF